MMLTKIAIDKLNTFIVKSTEQLFGLKEVYLMTDNERELFNIIREHDNPVRAVDFAINLLIDFSKKHGAPRGTSSVHPRESA